MVPRFINSFCMWELWAATIHLNTTYSHCQNVYWLSPFQARSIRSLTSRPFCPHLVHLERHWSIKVVCRLWRSLNIAYCIVSYRLCFAGWWACFLKLTSVLHVFSFCLRLLNAILSNMHCKLTWVFKELSRVTKGWCFKYLKNDLY